MDYNTVSEAELTKILQTYLDSRFWSIVDFEYAIKNAEIEEDIVWFNLQFCRIGLYKDTLEFCDVENMGGFEGIKE